jgi:hypothetical protein
MWEPQGLTTLWAFTACYRDSFTLLIETTLPFYFNVKTLCILPIRVQRVYVFCTILCVHSFFSRVVAHTARNGFTPPSLGFIPVLLVCVCESSDGRRVTKQIFQASSVFHKIANPPASSRYQCLPKCTVPLT